MHKMPNLGRVWVFVAMLRAGLSAPFVCHIPPLPALRPATLSGNRASGFPSASAQTTRQFASLLRRRP